MNDNRVLTANALEQKRGRGISGTGLKLIALVSTVSYTHLTLPTNSRV